MNLVIPLSFSLSLSLSLSFSLSLSLSFSLSLASRAAASLSEADGPALLVEVLGQVEGLGASGDVPAFKQARGRIAKWHRALQVPSHRNGVTRSDLLV